MDTIYAVASGVGKAGVSVVRVSGPQARKSLESLAGSVDIPRQLFLRTIRDELGDVIDRGLVVRFDAAHSFTGEAVGEFHVHGSVAVTDLLLKTLSRHDGLRLAEPGEFTRRAFLNGRIGLTEVEGLADLINAETEAQRIQALNAFSGGLSRKVTLWRQDLVQAIALATVAIDFSDEELPDSIPSQIDAAVTSVYSLIEKELSGIGTAQAIRNGFRVAIIGPPNIGKSTLLNAIAGRSVALTTDVPGTTRDVVEVRVDIDGLPVVFQDTAGIRETTDFVESLGIERSITAASEADLRIFLLSESDEKTALNASDDDIVLVGKGDLVQEGNRVSGFTGYGVRALITDVGQRLRLKSVQAGSAVNQRHEIALQKSHEHLQLALGELEFWPERAELLAEELRLVTQDLAELTGEIETETILDQVFSAFCLGK